MGKRGGERRRKVEGLLARAGAQVKLPVRIHHVEEWPDPWDPDKPFVPDPIPFDDEHEHVVLMVTHRLKDPKKPATPDNLWTDEEIPAEIERRKQWAKDNTPPPTYEEMRARLEAKREERIALARAKDEGDAPEEGADMATTGKPKAKGKAKGKRAAGRAKIDKTPEVVKDPSPVTPWWVSPTMSEADFTYHEELREAYLCYAPEAEVNRWQAQGFAPPPPGVMLKGWPPFVEKDLRKAQDGRQQALEDLMAEEAAQKNDPAFVEMEKSGENTPEALVLASRRDTLQGGKR